MEHNILKDVKGLLMDENLLVLDMRPVNDFAIGFMRGSLFVPVEDLGAGNLLAGLIPSSTKIVVVINEGQQIEDWLVDLIRQSGKEGYEVLYWTLAVISEFRNEMDMVIVIEPDEFAMDIPFDDLLEIADVRSAAEYEEGHVAGARSLPLEDLSDPANIALLGEDSNLYVYCSNGERSMMAASLLKRHGMHNLRVVEGTWENISTTPGVKVEKDAKKLN